MSACGTKRICRRPLREVCFDPKQTSFAAFTVEKIGYRKATRLEVAELSTMAAPGLFFVLHSVVTMVIAGRVRCPFKSLSCGSTRTTE